jgi:hypothetical protein
LQLDLHSRFQDNWSDIPCYIELGRAGLGQISLETEGEGVDGDEVEEAAAPVCEIARDPLTIASIVEESFA